MSWTDLDAWRARIRDSATLAERREVVRAWAEAAGGRVEGNALILPPELPRGLALAELKSHGRIALFEVVVAEKERAAAGSYGP